METMRVIISSQYLYFFPESPPDPSTLEAKFSLNDLAICRAAQGKTSKDEEGYKFVYYTDGVASFSS